ncbi:hypothetical protein KY284_024522 [Solanum tuberosum]|nr:hypothetical protein KY284_024522 [Solanum tuberosum]
MASQSDNSVAFSAAELEFLAEDEMVEIVPNMRMEPLNLISGDFGPFRPQIAAQVPLWLAVALKKRGKCTIRPPEWMSVEKLTQLLEAERDSEKFQLLPFHYVEISRLLFDHAREDIPDIYMVRSLIEDIKDVRFHKIGTGLEIISKEVTYALRLKNLSAMEANIVRPFVTKALQTFHKLNTTEAIPESGSIPNRQRQAVNQRDKFNVRVYQKQPPLSLRNRGVNYGTLGNNLPPPSQVAQFLKDKTIIDKIKIFDVNPDILKAFANTNISITVTIPNGEIPKLLDIGYAKSYVEANIKPFYPQTKIDVIAVGNEILHWETPEVQNKLVGAMRTLYQALTQSGINTIKVSTPHSLGILLSSNPPSLAKFRPGWDVTILAPMLQFLRETKGPFMVNPYPYFGYNPEQVGFLLFKQNKGVFDKFSRRTYSNMFDVLLDAVFMSMKRLGYDDVDIVAAETGWPSFGESFEPQCTVDNAASYNGGLVRKIVSGIGSPLMPHRKIETYLFGLFNENTKPGSNAERNFGLFRPDFTPVYNIGIMKGQQLLPIPQPSKPLPQPALPQPQPRGPIPVAKPVPIVPAQPSPRLPAQPGPRLPAHPGPKPVGPMGKKFCMPKPQATDAQLQASLDWACTNQGVDCGPVQAGGPCFNPNTVRSHAAYVMNSYYQIKGKNDFNCDFSGSAAIVFADPSYGTCKYLS